MQHTYQAVADNETLSAINNLLALSLFVYKISNTLYHSYVSKQRECNQFICFQNKVVKKKKKRSTGSENSL